MAAKISSIERAEAPPTPEQDAAHRTIVVVNDSQEILDLMREILEEEGYSVRLYSYALQDLGEVKALAPDLIILDFMIGGEDQGWQLLQKLRLDRETQHIPILVCTAAVKLARELDGHLRSKNIGVVIKPFDIDDLLRQVNAAWESIARDAIAAAGAE